MREVAKSRMTLIASIVAFILGKRCVAFAYSILPGQLYWNVRFYLTLRSKGENVVDVSLCSICSVYVDLLRMLFMLFTYAIARHITVPRAYCTRRYSFNRILPAFHVSCFYPWKWACILPSCPEYLSSSELDVLRCD